MSLNITKEEIIQASIDYQKNVCSHKNMDPNYVIKLPLKEQIEYADNITTKYATNETFLQDIVKNFKGISEDTNACVIGNLAYIAYVNNIEFLLLALSKLREN